MSPSAFLASDSDLARQIAAGDRGALEQLYLQHAGAIYRFALALGGNAAWAADATQEAFLQFALRAGGYQPHMGSLGGYLCGIARFQMLAVLREPQPAELPDDDDAAAWSDDPAVDPCHLLVRRQSTQALLDGIRRLPYAYREAVTLVDLQEREYAEAAQIAAIPLNTLRTRLHRGRRQLARMLGAHDAPDNSPSAHRSDSHVPG